MDLGPDPIERNAEGRVVDLEAVSMFFPPPGESDVEDPATRAAIERAWSYVGELAATYERRVGPRWIDRAVRHQVRQILHELRARIEDTSDERFTLDNPAIELKLLVPWPFSGELRLDAKRPIENLRFHHFTTRDVVDGNVPEDRIKWVLYELRQFAAFAALTNNVAVVQWKDPATGEPLSQRLLTKALDEWLDQETGTRETDEGVEGPPEAIERRRELAERFFQPFQLGTGHGTPCRNAPHLKGEQGYHTLAFSVDLQSGKHVGGFVGLLVWPLVLDQTIGRAYFPVALNLVLSDGDLKDLTAEELAEFWADLLREDPEPDSEAAMPTKHATSETSTLSQPEPPTGLAARLLFEGRTRMDRRAAQLVGFMDGTALPRKWGRVRTWDELVQDEVGRLRESHGEAAFENAPGIRGPLLRRTWTAKGEELVELTREAEEDLLEREGPRGFRRAMKNEDGIPTEFLVKQWRAGGGRIRIRLSWYGLAWPLVAEAHDAEEKRLREAKTAAAVRLFDELNEDEKRRVDDGLALLGTLKDARLVMDALLHRFGTWGENPVRFPAGELRTLLECETDPHGHERVWAALRALQRIEYGYEAVSVGRDLAGKAVGPLVADVVYEPKGKGSHTDGDFYVTLSELALGCLRAFKVAGSRIRDARKVFRFDWAAKLEKDAREGLDFVQGFSALAPYFDRAKGFTPHQTRLRTWLENNLTLRKDATSKGREAHRVPYNAADAGEPRVYTSDFCPLLDPSRRYYAALGHFPKNAETGRKLKGRPQAETATGGAKTGGLLEVLGYDLPPGRADAGRTKVAEAALKDLRAVVEEALGGRVVGRRNGQWMTLSEADRVRAEELLEDVSWFLFVAEDFRARMHQTIEAHHENRRRRGETDRAVRVTTDRPTYEKALEDQGEDAGVGTADLRARLYAARKERKLTTEAVGKVFGVSKKTVSEWERGRDRGGAPIPEDRRASILRWIEKGEGPTEDELKALTARRQGGKKRASL